MIVREEKMNIAKLIDQTMLKPEATTATIKQICSEARENHFCAVVVNSCHVKLVKKNLKEVMFKQVLRLDSL